MSYRIIIVLFFFTELLFAQQPDSTFIDSLNKLRGIIYSATNDSIKLQYNEAYFQSLYGKLSEKGSYKYSFEQLTDIGIKESSDKAFTLYNWNVVLANGTNKYFAIMHLNSKSKKNSKEELVVLQDATEADNSTCYKVLDHRKWIGALYYEIIPVKRRRKVYYVLLGWDGNNRITNKKIIETLTIQGNSIRFGVDVFKNSTERMKKRVVFEYAEDVVMSLKYHADQRAIVFDHLSPSSPNLEGVYEYYGPDFTYNSYQYEKGKWVLKEDIQINGKESNKVYSPKSTEKEKKIYSPK